MERFVYLIRYDLIRCTLGGRVLAYLKDDMIVLLLVQLTAEWPLRQISDFSMATI